MGEPPVTAARVMSAKETVTGVSVTPALKHLLSYVLAVICLAWVFHDTHPDRLATDIASINWWWIPGAILCDVASYVCQGIRWRTLLAPAGELSMGRATQAIYIGLFTNEIVPMRLGELVRAYFASRWISRPFADVVPSMLLERLIDGIWLALSVAVAALLVPLPARVVKAAEMFGLAVFILTAVFVAVILRRPPVSLRPAPSGGPLSWVGDLITRLAAGLRRIGSVRTLSRAGLVSAGIIVFQAAAFWLVMRGYRLDLPVSAGLIVFLIVHLGTAIPNAPANVGSFQFFTVFGLSLFGVDKTHAAGFSVVVFLILTVPLWALGSLALSRTGMSLADIRATARLER